MQILSREREKAGARERDDGERLKGGGIIGGERGSLYSRLEFVF